jgi:hypothetical protein
MSQVSKERGDGGGVVDALGYALAFAVGSVSKV